MIDFKVFYKLDDEIKTVIISAKTKQGAMMKFYERKFEGEYIKSEIVVTETKNAS